MFELLNKALLKDIKFKFIDAYRNKLCLKNLFAGAVLALTCTQAFAANGPSGEWELESLAGINSATLQQLGRPIKINFSQGRVSGSDGCNYINATYQSKDYHLKIMTHRMASTK